tara:strand:+ start:2039 stop:2506 length:468 start_codon:yes stop_codon:yes gene_type:complete
MKNNYIKEINIIGAKVDQITDFIKYEREAAIHDLIAENFFRIKKDNFVGPFTMNLSLNSGQLVIDIQENKNKKEYNITKSISGLKKIIKSYHLACSSYYEQIKSGSTDKLEEIENNRRKIHNEGAKNLDFILSNDFEIDLNTSRRLFTLLYSLFI